MQFVIICGNFGAKWHLLRRDLVIARFKKYPVNKEVNIKKKKVKHFVVACSSTCDVRWPMEFCGGPWQIMNSGDFFDTLELSPSTSMQFLNSCHA